VQTEAREHPDRQKEARLAGDPAALGRQPVARHDAINIRVMGEVLPPGVQHRGHADLRPEMLGIGRRLIARIKPIVPTAPTC